MQRTRHGAPYSVLTDASIRFVFGIDDAEPVVTGIPYFFFWEPVNQMARVIPKKAFNDSLKQAWTQIKRANPLVIESMERSFSGRCPFPISKTKIARQLEFFRAAIEQSSPPSRRNTSVFNKLKGSSRSPVQLCRHFSLNLSGRCGGWIPSYNSTIGL